MKQTKSITRDLMNKVAEEIQAAATKIAARHGLEIGHPRTAWDSAAVKTTTVFSACGAKERMAATYGFPVEKIGTIITLRNRRFKVVGFKPSARQYPVEVIDQGTGKMYRVPLYTIQPARASR